MISAALILALVFLAGYATQRGSTCAVSAAQEIVETRRATRLAGFMLCAFISLGVMALVHLAGWQSAHIVKEPSLASVILLGGILFGAGAYLNGRCAFGTIARLGSGELARVGTLLGFLVGSGIGSYLHMGIGSMKSASPLYQLSAKAMLIAAILGLASMAAIVRRGRPHENAGWSTLRAMTVIGLANGALLLLAQGWSYTSLLMSLANGTIDAIGWRGLLFVTLIGGAVTGAVRGRTFRLGAGTRRQWLFTVSGGCLMGLGANFIPGGNDRMLMLGLPMLLPNLIAAYAVMMVTLVALVATIGRPRYQ